ncbi:MAG: TIGR03905 family TSCPD domain-containing protein [Clostridia bacterium]|nr:TIGR03905 family TSCPD domain-containing protein [Clostridia bacterium]
MNYSYTPKGVCSRKIEITIEDNIIQSVRFTGGYHGNSQGVSRLAEGYEVSESIRRLEGIDCMGKGTSCPDQLSKALKEAMKE